MHRFVFLILNHKNTYVKVGTTNNALLASFTLNMGQKNEQISRKDFGKSQNWENLFCLHYSTFSGVIIE